MEGKRVSVDLGAYSVAQTAVDAYIRGDKSALVIEGCWSYYGFVEVTSLTLRGRVGNKPRTWRAPEGFTIWLSVQAGNQDYFGYADGKIVAFPFGAINTWLLLLDYIGRKAGNLLQHVFGPDYLQERETCRRVTRVRPESKGFHLTLGSVPHLSVSVARPLVPQNTPVELPFLDIPHLPELDYLPQREGGLAQPPSHSQPPTEAESVEQEASVEPLLQEQAPTETESVEQEAPVEPHSQEQDPTEADSVKQEAPIADRGKRMANGLAYKRCTKRVIRDDLTGPNEQYNQFWVPSLRTREVRKPTVFDPTPVKKSKRPRSQPSEECHSIETMASHVLVALSSANEK